jgi:hypothetical protein
MKLAARKKLVRLKDGVSFWRTQVWNPMWKVGLPLEVNGTHVRPNRSAVINNLKISLPQMIRSQL